MSVAQSDLQGHPRITDRTNMFRRRERDRLLAALQELLEERAHLRREIEVRIEVAVDLFHGRQRLDQE